MFGTSGTSSGRPLGFNPAAPGRHFDLSCCSGTRFRSILFLRHEISKHPAAAVPGATHLVRCGRKKMEAVAVMMFHIVLALARRNIQLKGPHFCFRGHLLASVAAVNDSAVATRAARPPPPIGAEALQAPWLPYRFSGRRCRPKEGSRCPSPCTGWRRSSLAALGGQR